MVNKKFQFWHNVYLYDEGKGAIQEKKFVRIFERSRYFQFCG
jgi:hypothetical protein